MPSGILLKRDTTIFTIYLLITIWIASNLWTLGLCTFFVFQTVVLTLHCKKKKKKSKIKPKNPLAVIIIIIISTIKRKLLCHLDICFFHFKIIVYLTNSGFNNKNICYALRNLKIHIFRVGPTAYLSMLSMIQIVFIILFGYPCNVYFSPYICHTMHARWLQKFQAYAPVHRKCRGWGGGGH